MRLSAFIIPKNFQVILDGCVMGYAANKRQAHKRGRKWAKEFGIKGPVTVVQVKDPGHMRLYHSH